MVKRIQIDNNITEFSKFVNIDKFDVEELTEKAIECKEDFEKFMTGLTQAIAFINKKQPLALDDSDKKEKLEVDLEENLGKTEIGTEIKFDIDFE